jgi:hypothetical protein
VPVASAVAPEGVAARAWRGGARVPFGGSGAPKSAVVRRGVPVTAPKSGRWYSGLRRWCRPGCRWLLRRAAGGTPVGADASKPRVGPARRPPRRVGLSGPWVRLAALRGGWVCRARGPVRRAPEGGWVVGPSGGPSGCSSEEGRWGVLGCAAGGCCLSEEGRRCRLRRWVRAPEGGWAHVGPRWRCGLSGASPIWSVLPPGFSLPKKVERVHRGGDFLSLGMALWLPRRSGAVRVRVHSLEAEAPWVHLRVCVCFPGAEAPVGRLQKPLRGSSAPPRGVGLPGAASLFHAARRLCGARHCRSAAGPTLPVHRGGPGVPSPPRRFRGAAEGIAPRRAALDSLSQAEAQGGELPVAGRGPWSGGGESSRALCGKPPGGGEGLSSSWSAPGRRTPFSRERESLNP